MLLHVHIGIESHPNNISLGQITENRQKSVQINPYTLTKMNMYKHRNFQNVDDDKKYEQHPIHVLNSIKYFHAHATEQKKQRIYEKEEEEKE